MFLLIPLLTLSSCGPAKLNINTSSDNHALLTLSEEELSNSLQQKQDRLIYLYLSTCLVCQTVEGYLDSYIERTGAFIYKMPGPTFPYDLLDGLDPLPVYPALLFIKSGEVQTVRTREIVNENNLTALLNKRLNLINSN